MKDRSVLILSSHPARGSDFWYTISANAKRGVPRIAAANRFPAQGWPRLSRPNGRGRACRAPPLRTWEASDGSLRNFTGMTREEDAALVQFHLLRCIIPGSLRRLIRCIGGGFRFPPPPMSGKERKLPGTGKE